MQTLVLVGNRLMTIPEYSRFYNEEYRKGTPARLRTTSKQFRAGTRRTKEAQR